VLTEIIDISCLREKRRVTKNKKELDVKASIVVIEQCLFMLNNNNLPQTELLKKELSKTLKSLKKELK